MNTVKVCLGIVGLAAVFLVSVIVEYYFLGGVF